MPLLRLFLLWMPACLLSLTAGCSSVNSALGGNTATEAKAEVQWDYARDAIQIELDSSPDLNDFFSQPHTVVLGVFQTADTKTFAALLKDADKIKQILASGNAGSDVLQLDRFVVSPDKHVIVHRGIVHRGIVDNAARLFRIPLNMDSSGIISTTYAAQPAHLALKLRLGRQRITNARSLTFDADSKPNIETVPLNNDKLEIDIDQQARDAAQASTSAARKLRN